MGKSTKADSFVKRNGFERFWILSRAVLCKMLCRKSYVFCIVVDVVSETFLGQFWNRFRLILDAFLESERVFWSGWWRSFAKDVF